MKIIVRLEFTRAQFTKIEQAAHADGRSLERWCQETAVKRAAAAKPAPVAGAKPR